MPEKAIYGKDKILTDHISVLTLARKKKKKRKSQICEPSPVVIKGLYPHYQF